MIQVTLDELLKFIKDNHMRIIFFDDNNYNYIRQNRNEIFVLFKLVIQNKKHKAVY